MTTKSKEDAVRSAASALKKAIDDATAEGLTVQWPSRAADLDAIAISETGRAKVVTELVVDARSPAAIDPKVAAKAADAAQSAAEKAIDKAEAAKK